MGTGIRTRSCARLCRVSALRSYEELLGDGSAHAVVLGDEFIDVLVQAALENAVHAAILQPRANAAGLALRRALAAIGGGDLLILKEEMPRSLASCYEAIVRNLDAISGAYGRQGPAQRQARAVRARLQNSRMDGIIQRGLHEFISEFITETTGLGGAITEQFLI